LRSPDKVYKAVIEQEFDRDFGKSPVKQAHMARQNLRGIKRGGRDPQVTAWVARVLAHLLGRLPEFLQRPGRAFVIILSGLGKRQAARCTIQQARPQARLQSADVLADCTLGKIQGIRRGSKAALLHHPHKHCGVGNRLHGNPQLFTCVNNIIPKLEIIKRQ
jgi:hypothetical protein